MLRHHFYSIKACAFLVSNLLHYSCSSSWPRSLRYLAPSPLKLLQCFHLCFCIPLIISLTRSCLLVPDLLQPILRSPAPHDYGVPSNLKSTGGGQFSTAFPPTALEATIRSKRGIPGPGSYRVQASSGKYVGKVPMARTPSEADRQASDMEQLYRK